MNRSLVLVAAAALALPACTSAPAGDLTSTSSPASMSSPTLSVVTEVVISTVTNPPKPQDLYVDQRLGYGSLKLGMSEQEAIATGLAGTGKDFREVHDGQCRMNDHITVSTNGVERIVLPKEARTSAGIGVGDILADVKKAYPSATEDGPGYFADIPGDARLLFETADAQVPRRLTDEVTAIKLLKRRLACKANIL